MSSDSPSPAQPAGEYAVRGEYHRHLDKRWAHYPIYVEKIRLIEQILDALPRTANIVDLGCGEGVLVEKYRAQGYEFRNEGRYSESGPSRQFGRCGPGTRRYRTFEFRRSGLGAR